MLQLRDAHRLATLDAYGLMDSPIEQPFDTIVADAAAVAGAPVAMISLLDDRRQWFKAKIGIDHQEDPIEHSFCAHAIQSDGVFVVEDARTDSRFCNLPAVQRGEIRFYAGVPLTLRNGVSVGTLCVIDSDARPGLQPRERRALEGLARRTVAAFELRREMRDAAASLELDQATDTLIAQALSSLVSASAALERLGATSVLAHLEQVIAMVDDLDRGAGIA